LKCSSKWRVTSVTSHACLLVFLICFTDQTLHCVYMLAFTRLEAYTNGKWNNKLPEHNVCIRCWTVSSSYFSFINLPVTLVLLLAWTGSGTVFMKWATCWENTCWILLCQSAEEEILLHFQIVPHEKVGRIAPSPAL
jgi:hypothetical protein